MCFSNRWICFCFCFFVVFREEFNILNGKITLFGHVTEGFNVVDDINDVYTDDKNHQNVRIKRAYVLHDPFEAPDRVCPFSFVVFAAFKLLVTAQIQPLNHGSLILDFFCVLVCLRVAVSITSNRYI